MDISITSKINLSRVLYFQWRIQRYSRCCCFIQNKIVYSVLLSRPVRFLTFKMSMQVTRCLSVYVHALNIYVCTVECLLSVLRKNSWELRQMVEILYLRNSCWKIICVCGAPQRTWHTQNVPKGLLNLNDNLSCNIFFFQGKL